MKEISFRSVTIEDVDILLAWRNDPETRKNSIRKGKVKKEDHIQWVKDMLASKADNLLLIAEWDGKPVGTFRLDKFKVHGAVTSPDMRLVSYAVAPEMRKQGFGRAIVEEGCASYGQEYGLIAQVRKENVASIKILEACDFQCLGELEKGLLSYVRPNSGGLPTVQ